MSGYLRRLATTGAAYTAASILSKVIAVALLPLYTRYLTPTDYGAAEVMFSAVVAASIVVRFGLIEAVLRFYYKDGEDPDRVVASSFAGRGAVLAAFVALLVHTMAYAGFYEDPITWVLLAVGASLAHAAAGDDPVIRKPA